MLNNDTLKRACLITSFVCLQLLAGLANGQQPPVIESPELPSAELPSTELPSTETPSTETPSTETPSTELLGAELPDLSNAELPEAIDVSPDLQIDDALELDQPPIELLGGVVEPGSSAILPWDLESSFSDVSAPSSVLVVNGTKPGPTMCLTAAIHGDELNGIEIVRRVMYELKAVKLTGAVIGVPIVNLEGFKRASRYLPDRRDLNRYFPGRVSGSYASRIAYSFFHKIVEKCDFLIDIHTGSQDRTNLPQIRADLNQPRVADLASKLGSIVVLQSRGGSGTLRRATTDAGIPAVTLETGAPNDLQKDAVEKGVDTIAAALRSLGFTAKSFWKGSKEPVYYRSRWVRAKQGGILFSKVALGDSVKEGDLLGLLSNPITNKTTEVRSTLEGRIIGMALNQIMYPGFAAYHIGLKSSAVEAAQPPAPVDEQELDLAQIDKLDENTDKPDSDSVAPVVDGETQSNDKANEQEATTIEEMELPTADDSD